MHAIQFILRAPRCYLLRRLVSPLCGRRWLSRRSRRGEQMKHLLGPAARVHRRNPHLTHRPRSADWILATDLRVPCHLLGCCFLARWRAATGGELKAPSPVVVPLTFARPLLSTGTWYNFQHFTKRHAIDGFYICSLVRHDRWALRSSATTWAAHWIASTLRETRATTSLISLFGTVCWTAFAVAIIKVYLCPRLARPSHAPGHERVVRHPSVARQRRQSTGCPV